MENKPTNQTNLEKILFVDDAAGFIECVIRPILGDLADYPRDDMELIKLLNGKTYPLIFMDRGLWGWIDGEFIVRNIREGRYGERNRAAIIISCSSSGIFDGCNDAMTDGYSPASFKEILGKYLPAHAEALEQRARENKPNERIQTNL